MKKIAIDIVLMLPEEIEKICIELNKESDKSRYVSFLDDNRPHISLGMGNINKDDLSIIENELQIKLSSLTALDLSILELKTHSFRDYYIYDFSISLNEKIKNLHTICMEVIEKYTISKSTIDMFDEKERIDELTLGWTNMYKEKSSGENYKPHITLGVGIPQNTPSLPIEFQVDKIAIFQLGPLCTCKNKLTEFSL